MVCVHTQSELNGRLKFFFKMAVDLIQPEIVSFDPPSPKIPTYTVSLSIVTLRRINGFWRFLAQIFL